MYFIIIGALVLIAIFTDIMEVGSTFIGIIAGLVIALLISMIVEKTDPPVRPMDVYRGKTTLEITYRDGVAVDSTVVFKNLEE